MKRNLWVVWIAVVVFVTAVKVCWAEEGLRDIKDPVLLSGTPWGIYIALAFFVTALTVGLFWRQKRKAQKEARPELPYWAKALKNLSQLEKGELRSQVLIPQLFT
ncbi:MAG: hypothetical protein KC618_08105, partial [Candidatus Omnitrophica bacterium]|nr:hypothetical protein [Candidatus Omnitrophota bacterium]